MSENDNNMNQQNNSEEQHNQIENTSNNERTTQQPPYLYSWDGRTPHKKNKGLKSFALVVTICLVLTISLIAWSVSMGYLSLNDNTDFSDTDDSIDTISAPAVIKTPEPVEFVSDLTKLYDTIQDCCVTVQTNDTLGSGFVVSEDGYIITNHHVIKDAKSLKVIFYDDTEYEAELIGSDSVSDIAVLKIEGEFTPIEIGNSDNLKIGQEVVAVGTPYDISLAGTMNSGIISGIARDVRVTNETGTVVKTMTLIQTDTSINPGNSGGPLINMAGQVIGINTLKLMREYEGLGFAIPINNAVDIANKLIEYGQIDERPDNDFVKATPRLNVTVMNTEDAIDYFGINIETELPKGAFVTEVNMNSSIFRAGLRLYDIITEFNGNRVESKEDLTRELSEYKAGDSVTIKAFRIDWDKDNGEYYDISFTLDPAAVQ